MMNDRLTDLMTRMRACHLCDGLPLGPNPLFQLSPQVRVLIVGQAPGRLTHAKGRPFDDPSGVRLRAWLGLDRDQFYGDPRLGMFPMGLCFPGTGKGGDAPPRPECAATWRAPVLQALPKPWLTLVLGRYAIAYHRPDLARLPVTEAVRQAADDPDPGYVLPHPSPRNTRWLRQNPWFEDEIVPRIRAEVTACLAEA